MSGILKNIITVIALVAIAGLGYYFFVMNKNSSLDNSDGQAGTTDIESEVFLDSLTDIDGIDLHTEIFSDARFNSLREFGGEVQQVDVGRTNPFAN